MIQVADRNIYIVKHTLRKVNLTLTKNCLKDVRNRKGLSQEKLAELACVSRQTIISIESGRYVPSLELALKFARIFRCKVEDLFGL